MGRADSSHLFVQEPGLVAPLGVAVIDNKIIVSQPPDLIVYTDVDRDLKFDASKGDTREVLLTGFNGQNHDHSLHSVTVGPDGKWVFNSGNTGGMFHRQVREDLPHFRLLTAPDRSDRLPIPHDGSKYAGQPSDDGHTYVGGFSVRMNPDGTDAAIIGHNYRNSYEQSQTSLGDIFQNDNDDPPALPGELGDGIRELRLLLERRPTGPGKPTSGPVQTTPIAEWRQEDPGHRSGR